MEQDEIFHLCLLKNKLKFDVVAFFELIVCFSIGATNLSAVGI